MITPSLSFLLLLFTVASAVPSFLNYSCITANNPASTTYLNNLNILLTNLTSNTQIDYGFYTSFFGHNTDTAYAIGMCRGDVNLNDCRSCLNDSRLLLTQICPNYQAVGWYEYCMLRYSNLSMLGRVADHPQFSLWNPYFISSKEFNQFNKSLNTLMDKLRIEASGGDYRRKYAFQNVTSGIQSYKGIFGLAQCTPDLSRQQCDDCLFGAFSEIQGCCNGRRGARVIKPSCNIRYEIYPFLTSTIDAFSPLNAPGKEASNIIGYMAPEYAMYGQFSVKSDVFSFGVLVLEIVSGQKHNCTRRGDTLEELPLTFAWRSWMEGRAANIIDPSLSNSAENEILRCIHIGLLCVQENLVERPTMASIVLMLNSSSLSLPVPMEPAFFAGSRAKSPRVADKQSEEYILKGTNESTGISVQEFTITKIYSDTK
ncbi:hypothetical protein Ahy_B09g100050 [Arachis hypogaea]|uniref:Gnk2-homologous domain-containing protein n=1 Tax=Arachis hypogaea TaxID=3818 RepID=A0A444XVL8_ARAHY|nr:hypothetical protein Ahy_B09g100050 [Arachis hypogaea]